MDRSISTEIFKSNRMPKESNEQRKAKKIGFVLFSLLSYLIFIYFIHFERFRNIDYSYRVDINYYLSNGALFRDLLFHFLMVIILHLIPYLLLSLAQYKQYQHESKAKIFLYVVLQHIIFWLSVLVLNGMYFPESFYAVYVANVDNPEMLLITLVALLMIANWKSFSAVWKLKKKVWLLSLIAIVVFVALLIDEGSGKHQMTASKDRPNIIIIIGLDSVTPVYSKTIDDTNFSFIHKFLDNSINFSNALTPLARTFPAWASVLTGKNPVTSQVRYNLDSLETLGSQLNLANYLSVKEYQTVFAQDERRFNNIDESIGFQTIIGPKASAAEFLLASVMDSPLINLFLLSESSEYFFPYNFNNRADHRHYNPSVFNKKVKDGIYELNADLPLFLAAHFTMAHYPYTSKFNIDEQNYDQFPVFENKYIRSIKILDEQVSQLFRDLEELKVLDNAWVFLLSDHGEAMPNLVNSFWRKEQNFDPKFDIGMPFPLEKAYSGHGTDVIDAAQHHVFLSLQIFVDGKRINESQVVNRSVSLIDVFPTVYKEIFNEKLENHFDGVSLLNPVSSERPLPVETGIKFQALNDITAFDTKQVLKEVQNYYTVNEAGLLRVKEEKRSEVVNSKDVSVHWGHWLFAIREWHLGAREYEVVLVDKKTGEWTHGRNPELISEAPIEEIIRYIEENYPNHYQKHIGQISIFLETKKHIPVN